LPAYVSRDARTQIAVRRDVSVLIFSIILCILLAGPISCTTVSSNSVANTYTGTSWNTIRAGLTTPERIDEYLNACSITYKAEKPNTLNHPQAPEETIRLKAGDCEDYAYLITDALMYHGYEAKIMSVEATTAGGLLIHAVAVYRDPGTDRWYYIHGYRFRGLSIGISKGFDTQTDLARYVAEKMNGRLYQYFVMSPDAFGRIYDAMIN
jgi:hypothetical protein